MVTVVIVIINPSNKPYSCIAYTAIVYPVINPSNTYNY
jgi:hypothetical protein